MHESNQDRLRLAAAQFIVERGYGKAPERIEILKHEEKGPLPGSELTPEQAYFQLIHGQYKVDVVEEVPELPGPNAEPKCLGDILAEPVASADEDRSAEGGFAELGLLT